MASDNMIEQNWENNDDVSASTSNGIIFPNAGQTLYYQDRYFYVTSIHMDIIDYYEFIDKYVITYQINGNLSGDDVVYAYLDSYSDDGALLDHRIIGLENDGMNTGEIHVPARTVRIELVSNKSRTSQSSTKRSSQTKSSSKKSTSMKNTNPGSKSDIKNTDNIDDSKETTFPQNSWLSTKNGEQKTKSGTLDLNPNIIRIEFDANFRH